MSAYLISFSKPHTKNTNWLDEYSSIVNPLLKKHSGKIISRGSPEIMERGNKWEKATLIEFPSSNEARSFMNDPEYHYIKGLRIYHTSGELYLLGPADQ